MTPDDTYRWLIGEHDSFEAHVLASILALSIAEARAARRAPGDARRRDRRAGRRRLPEAAFDCGAMPHAANESIGSNFCQARFEGK